METVRNPAVAGTFYPADPVSLSTLIDSFIDDDKQYTSAPKAIIAPHAGYVYSGAVAGQVYAQLAPAASVISRVVLLGPSHRFAFRGMAVPTSKSFRTPLGDIAIDAAAIQQIIDLPGVGFMDQAHEDEHSLEVHLPFLQHVLDDFTLVPIVVGEIDKERVAGLLQRLWGGPETLIVISSDLSHYESYERACELDARTTNKIVDLKPTLVGGEACGCRPVNGLLHFLKEHGLNIETVDLRNSGNTAGSKDRVVGYGAWRVMLDSVNSDEWNQAERQTLLQLAREAIRSRLTGESGFNVNSEQFSNHLTEQRASFVTINLDGQLRGCIGSLVAHRPLVLDVAHNAQASAFKDPRFPQLTMAEYQGVDIHISILGKPWPVHVSSSEDLIRKIQPGVHGLIIKESGHQATYLPSVWEQLPDPNQFVSELRRKAGLSVDDWTDETEVLFYTTEEFS